MLAGAPEDGQLECWNEVTDWGEDPPPDGRYEQVSVFRNTGCVLDSAGAVSCFGNQTWALTPLPTTPLATVSTGSQHACGITRTGGLLCWGAVPAGSPILDESTTWIEVSAGWGTTCALDEAGQVSCWGPNDEPDLLAPPDATFATIAAGWDHACGVGADSALQCWGRDEYGEANPPP